MAKRMIIAVGLLIAACGEANSNESASVTEGGTANQTTANPSPGTEGPPTSGATDSGGPTSTAQGTDSMSASESTGRPDKGSATDLASASASVSDSASATDSASASATEGASATDSASASASAGDGTETGIASTTAGLTAGSGSDTLEIVCVPRVCEGDGQIHECGDCADNDGDGAIDCADPECFGPCDDSEAEFGSPLEDKDPCKQDCYFDGNGGQGGGDCQWNLKCDMLEPGGDICGYKPDLVEDDKCVDGDAASCADHCEPPNGCDCFGCCTIDGVDRFIGSPGCKADDLGACKECTKQDEWCGNPCEDGEVCFPDLESSQC